jgi:hypothetical protein
MYRAIIILAILVTLIGSVEFTDRRSLLLSLSGHGTGNSTIDKLNNINCFKHNNCSRPLNGEQMRQLSLIRESILKQIDRRPDTFRPTLNINRSENVDKVQDDQPPKQTPPIVTESEPSGKCSVCYVFVCVCKELTLYAYVRVCVCACDPYLSKTRAN